MHKKSLVSIYFITSIIWIFGSNYLTKHYVPSSLINIVERSKEILYIIVTGGFIYFFITKKIELSVTQADKNRLSTLANQLAESQQQYKSLFEYSPDIVYIIDLNGTITALNPQFDVISGYKREEMIGKNIKILLPKRYQRNLKRFISAVVEDSKPLISEMTIPNANGVNMILQSTCIPMKINETNTGIIGYMRDMTTLRKTEERLRMTEKLSVVGELSASVAHEIRNPLTSLKGFVQLMQTEDNEHQNYYQIMSDELDRINHIVGELLLLAKPQHLKFSIEGMNKLLTDVISLLNPEASFYNVEIVAHFPKDAILIECEPNQIKQLLINIIKNAIEASIKGGLISIYLEQVPNDRISITVKDNGIGISKERLARIGEPFYSSKEKGTGLGLTVSFKIIQTHKGTIQVESNKNQGTSVEITLPIKQQLKKLPF